MRSTFTTYLRLVLALFISVLAINANGQQIEQFSQFDEQMYILNPGVAGTTDYFEAKGVNRSQWTGVTDAPRTFAMSLQAPLKNPHLGLGGFLMTDNVGPTRRTSLQFSWTYQLFLNDDLKLGLGVSAGLLQFTIDGSKITLVDEGDPALFSEMNSQTVFDAKFGAYLHKDNWYAGFSLPQLLQNQVQLFESTSSDLSKLEDHYLIMGGYTHELNNQFKVQANALAKFVSPVSPALDANIKAYYQNKVNVGVGYRHQDALIFMAGYEYREAISIGFSYDMTTSALKNYSNGTYEVMVGFRFNQ